MSTSSMPGGRSQAEKLNVKPDAQWLRARKELFAQVKSDVIRRLGSEPQDVRAYTREYESEFACRWRVSSKVELLNAIETADIAYGGDFHAFGQAQRTHVRILRSISDERPVIVGLECVSVRHQKWLDKLVAGQLLLDEFPMKVNWQKEWGFSWEHYRPIFEIALRRKFHLLALNSSGAKSLRDRASLEAREERAAQVIERKHRRSPASLMYVIFGDLHLASRHLPSRVRSRVGARGQWRDVIIHLNSEKLYFQLARQGLELSVDVVRLKRDRFCILSSPPWVKWQSYLLFLEHSSDLDLDLDALDPTDHVARFAAVACKDLGLKIDMNDLSIYGGADARIWPELSKKLSRSDREIGRALWAGGRSFFTGVGGVGYLTRATVNHASELAGQYIHAKLNGRKRPLWKLPGDFPALIWSEAVSFFISKLINHKRQSDTIFDLQAQLAMLGPKDRARETLKLVLDSSMSELVLLSQGRRRKLRTVQKTPRRRASYIEASRILGAMMGERLYVAYRSRKLKKQELERWLRRDVTSRSFNLDFDAMILRLASALASKQGRVTGLVTVKTKRERL